MALLFPPNFFQSTKTISPIFKFHSPIKNNKLRFRFPNAAALNTRAESQNTAIVWYKHDLRIEDHPGLVAAASNHRYVVPLYVFDRLILSRFSDEMLEILLFALEDLRKLLREQGSDLMIRFGTAEGVIRELVNEVQATSIILEEEVEHELRVLIEESLHAVSSSGVEPSVVMWSTPFYDITSIKDLPASFDDFKKLKLPVVSPILPPKLTGQVTDLSWGSLPTLAELKCFMEDTSEASNMRSKWASLKQSSAESVLQQKKLKSNFTTREAVLEENNDFKGNKSNKLENSAFKTSQGNLVGGGARVVLNALAAYLRYLEGTARYDFQELHEKLRQTEKREGASFPALFGSALLLGIISRRRVYFEAIKYEKERNGGFISPFGYSTTTVASAINSVSSMEWYWLLTLKGLKSGSEKFSVRTWRWNNYLIHYTVAGHEGPAILLVHGFGAFLDHYRDNIHPIAEAGNRVWAVTLLGFGKSEKPNIMYTELVWSELLRDFIIEVVGEPVHLVGNSIGGYSVAIVAGLWSSLAKSVVLMNSAGNIVPGYSALGYSKNRQTSGAAWFGARVLLLYLRFSIRSILKSFYPTKPDRCDDQLINEMLRASYDPGVTFVMESIFSFDISLPLNYLLGEFENKILVIQGMKDPLSDSRSFLAMFSEHCKGIVVKEIDAGHCPHDELPNEVNPIITEWVTTVESKASPVVSKLLEQS